MDQLLASLASFLNFAVESKGGMAVAAVLLSLVSWLLTKVPVIKDFVAKNEVLSHVVMVVLAVIPGVVTVLAGKASWMEAGMTALLALLSSLGLGAVTKQLTA